jgi:hypothetical protein
MNQDEREPYDYFKDENAPREMEQPASDDVVNNLRTDLLAASEVVPEEETILKSVDPKILAGLFILIAILCLVLFSLIGPGRSLLGKRLASLKNQAPTYTQQIPSTIESTTTTPIASSSTPMKTPTVHPTNTIVVIVNSPTQGPPTTTPTPESTCRDALTITMADVGQTMCVKGTIIETVTNPGNFLVIFDTSRGSFYWVTYDFVWSQAVLNTCYQTIGKIDQIGISPMMVFGYNNKPEPCP